jgi:AmmeMemoRadiSam system protein B
MILTREPSVAGMFYPEEGEALRQMVTQLLDRSPGPKVTGSVQGIIAPHAGYIYSGLTAAAAYRTVQGRKFDTVVIISPSHREYFRGISVYPGDAYRTPLGSVPVDVALREELLTRSPRIQADVAGHRDEHAIEVHLPFLQVVLPPFRLLPLVMGEQAREFSLELGRVLADVTRGKRILLVASSDLSHYHSSRVAEAIEKVLVDDVAEMAANRLMSDLEAGMTEACGGGPIVALLSALEHLGVRSMEILHHTNSGEVTGETKRVVGYLSAVGLSPKDA